MQEPKANREILSKGLQGLRELLAFRVRQALLRDQPDPKEPLAHQCRDQQEILSKDLLGLPSKDLLVHLSKVQPELQYRGQLGHQCKDHPDLRDHRVRQTKEQPDLRALRVSREPLLI
jgi:hypothetical protein